MLAVGEPGTALADHLSPGGRQAVVEQALELADYVVIDSPPLTDVSDALPLAAVADEVLIVARLGESKLSKLASCRTCSRTRGSSRPASFSSGRAPGAPATTTPQWKHSRGRRARRRRRAADSEESVGTRTYLT